jgi:hypothetical protein
MKAVKGFAASLLLCIAVSTLAQIAPTEANLRSAIAAGGSITFNASATIPVTTPLTIAVDTTIDGTGQNITIDGQGLTRLFEVNSGVHFTIKNLVLANGRAKGADANDNGNIPLPGFGGALKSTGGLITVLNCVFTNNSAIGGAGPYNPFIPTRPLGAGADGAGGAIWQTGGSLTIHDGSFIKNKAAGGSPGTGPQQGLGGAIFASAASATIDGATFLTNTAFGTGGRFGGNPGEGGAIYAIDSTLVVQGARFSNNSTAAGVGSIAAGGAISAEGATAVTVRESEFAANGVTGGGVDSFHAYNPSPGYGGAVYVGTNSTALIRESALHENTSAGGLGYQTANGSGYGGAIYVDGSLRLLNVTLAGNAAIEGAPTFYSTPPSDGGAIFSKGTVGATNVTVIGNSATIAALTAASGSFVIKNSLFGSNSGVTASSGMTDAGNNLSSTSTPVFTDASSKKVASIGVGPFGDYGGPTPTIPLLAGSPAINAADDAAAPPTDQRGRARPFGAHSDIGAFESSPPFYILGRVNGYTNSSQYIIFEDVTVYPDLAGNFRFLLPEGSHSFTFGGSQAVFRPNPLIIDLSADVQTHVTAFQLQTLSYDPDGAAPTFTFAGRANETWEFDVSNDLVNWIPVHTNTFSIDSPYSMPLTNVAFPIFMKGIKR